MTYKKNNLIFKKAWSRSIVFGESDKKDRDNSLVFNKPWSRSIIFDYDDEHVVENPSDIILSKQLVISPALILARINSDANIDLGSIGRSSEIDYSATYNLNDKREATWSGSNILGESHKINWDDLIEERFHYNIRWVNTDKIHYDNTLKWSSSITHKQVLNVQWIGSDRLFLGPNIAWGTQKTERHDNNICWSGLIRDDHIPKIKWAQTEGRFDHKSLNWIPPRSHNDEYSVKWGLVNQYDRECGESSRPQIDIKPEKPKGMSAELIFMCEHSRNIIFGDCIIDDKDDEDRNYYIVENIAYIEREDDNTEIFAERADARASEGSWLWNFTFTIPISEYEKIKDNPVVLIHMNQYTWRAKIEECVKSEQFNRNALSVTASSASIELNDHQLTGEVVDTTSAQQLSFNALNNPINTGYDLNWGIEDWSIPRGLTLNSSSIIDRILAIAAGSKSILISDYDQRILHVRTRAPIDFWGDIGEPEYIIPRNKIIDLSTRVERRERYNSIVVSGETHGVTANVMIEDGLKTAPMQVNKFITDQTVARERGRVELNSFGNKEIPTIETALYRDAPKLYPGSTIKADGKIGTLITIGVSARWADSIIIRQSLTLERHLYESL